jgi:hypothetical protein
LLPTLAFSDARLRRAAPLPSASFLQEEPTASWEGDDEMTCVMVRRARRHGAPGTPCRVSHAPTQRRLVLRRAVARATTLRRRASRRELRLRRALRTVAPSRGRAPRQRRAESASLG